MSNSLGLEFIANVSIPPGFILASIDDLRYEIVFDESRLVTNIVIESINCDEEGICKATRNTAILTGMLNYNVLIGDLRSAEPIDSIANSPTTQFSESGFLQINKTLGCSFNENRISTNYIIEYTKGEEFVVDVRGEWVFRSRNCFEFMKILNNPNDSKTFSIPYVIRIYALGERV